MDIDMVLLRFETGEWLEPHELELLRQHHPNLYEAYLQDVQEENEHQELITVPDIDW